MWKISNKCQSHSHILIGCNQSFINEIITSNRFNLHRDNQIWMIRIRVIWLQALLTYQTEKTEIRKQNGYTCRWTHISLHLCEFSMCTWYLPFSYRYLQMDDLEKIIINLTVPLMQLPDAYEYSDNYFQTINTEISKFSSSGETGKGYPRKIVTHQRRCND